jgi:hypothetical protein
MSSLNKGLLMAAGLLCVAPAAFAKDKPQAGFDPEHASALATVPVEIVLLNDRLRTQYTYQFVSVDPSIAQQSLAAIGPGVPYSPGGVAAGAVGGAIASALINAEMEAQARRLVEPALGTLRLAQCELDVGDALAGSIDAAVKASPWGASAPVARHVLSGKKDTLREVIAENRARYVFAASYSMTPDFSAVITTINASAYADTLPGAPRNWQKKPAWSDQVVIVSDRLHPLARTADDVAREIAREEARYKASDVNRLIREANAGDSYARTEAKRMMDDHKRALKRANETEWVPASIADRRSEMWSADGCARLKAALDANHREVGVVLAKLFAGELGEHLLTEPMAAFVEPVQVAPASPADAPAPERKVYVAPGNLYISRETDDLIGLGYRFSWMPLPKAAKAKD